MDEAERTRLAALIQLSHETRLAVIDEVRIDLRHPLLDPAQWTAGLLFEDRHGPHLSRPYIWFPWFGPYDRDELAAQRAEALAAEGLCEADAAGDLFYRHWFPEAVAYPGDTVTLSKIVVITEGDEFDHVHDREHREAYLSITRPSGETVHIAAPVVFIGVTSFTAEGNAGQITAEKLARRVCDHFGIAWITDFRPFHDELTLEEFALAEGQSLWEEWARLAAVLPDHWDAPIGTPTRLGLDRAINRATSLGYAWGLAETRQLRAPAKAARRSAQGARLAGQRSGESRRRKAEETWHPHALVLAQRARKQRSSASQDDVVADIQAFWAIKIPKAPGTKTLKAFVSAKERSGKLPRRTV
jgi:hypothetical protein